jgi:hypothetical protein
MHDKPTSNPLAHAREAPDEESTVIAFLIRRTGSGLPEIARESGSRPRPIQAFKRVFQVAYEACVHTQVAKEVIDTQERPWVRFTFQGTPV